VLYRTLFVVICASFAVGCKTVPADSDRPARITEVNEASRAALQETVNKVLGTEVTLSESALTDRSVLVIENWPRPTLEHPMPQGRIMEPPIRLLLVTDGSDCILIDTRDDSRHLLENTTCVAE
jgi:hypothetical protein